MIRSLACFEKFFKPTPFTSRIVVDESIYFRAAIEHAGNLTFRVFSNSSTWYFKNLAMFVTRINLLGSTFPINSM
eukprot:Gb_33549 [translate_table: standard]